MGRVDWRHEFLHPLQRSTPVLQGRDHRRRHYRTPCTLPVSRRHRRGPELKVPADDSAFLQRKPLFLQHRGSRSPAAMNFERGTERSASGALLYLIWTDGPLGKSLNKTGSLTFRFSESSRTEDH